MAREFSRKFYNSKAWKDCRDGYKQSVNHLCERCLKKGLYVIGEEVHHKVYLSPANIDDPYITLSWKNLELLCQSCHSIEHNRKHKEIVRKGLSFDSEGNLVQN